MLADEVSILTLLFTVIQTTIANERIQPVMAAGGRSHLGALSPAPSMVMVQPTDPAQPRGSSVPVMLAPYPHPAPVPLLFLYYVLLSFTPHP